MLDEVGVLLGAEVGSWLDRYGIRLAEGWLLLLRWDCWQESGLSGPLVADVHRVALEVWVLERRQILVQWKTIVERGQSRKRLVLYLNIPVRWRKSWLRECVLEEVYVLGLIAEAERERGGDAALDLDIVEGVLVGQQLRVELRHVGLVLLVGEQRLLLEEGGLSGGEGGGRGLEVLQRRVHAEPRLVLVETRMPQRHLPSSIVLIVYLERQIRSC